MTIADIIPWLIALAGLGGSYAMFVRARPQAKVDAATARKTGAESVHVEVQTLREIIDELRDEVSNVRAQLVDERRDCDRRIAALHRRIADLERRQRGG